MTTTIISNSMPHSYGQMTNQAVAKLISLQTAMERLNDAIATASSGYVGTPGTEFEIGDTPNLFGVQAGGTPGEQGAAYSYAVLQLYQAWAAFWTAAEAYIEQLDNGSFIM
jgi:hypothetical protein